MDRVEILETIFAALCKASPFAADELQGKNAMDIRNCCFVELGVNSIDYATVMSNVLDKYGLPQCLDEFARHNKIDEAVELILGLSNKNALPQERFSSHYARAVPNSLETRHA